MTSLGSRIATTPRSSVERNSRPLLIRLHALPRPLVPAATLVLVLVGVLAPPAVGLLALGLVAVFVAWVTYLSWPAVPASGRLVRVAMLGLVGVLAVTRLPG